ncbi:Flotillin-2 [Cichlidogyrus casuarinus]|uniref:Flotillin-2 n=1 Tax=Cichlidogyrus casuarinus TaxID=1844966 RepID=A0ABD2PWW7_9PLAT
MTLNPICENVLTSEGIPLTVTGVAQVKVMKDENLLARACEQLLGKERGEIESTILCTLEGHLRAILGTLSVEEVYKDREKFASLLRETASADVAKMGIEILSFTIKDIFDRVTYLNSFGKTQIAIVRKDADIGVAEAEKEAGISESNCLRTQQVNFFQADEEISSSSRNYELEIFKFAQETQQAKAQAELSYQLHEAKERQKIVEEEIKIAIVERKKLIELEEEEIHFKEKRLAARIRLPADAEAYRIEQAAAATKFIRIARAQAEAESIRLRGLAKAEAIRMKSMAMAEKMEIHAEAYQKYGEIAMLSLVLNVLPRMATQVAAPLGKITEIVQLNHNNQPIPKTK